MNGNGTWEKWSRPQILLSCSVSRDGVLRGFTEYFFCREPLYMFVSYRITLNVFYFHAIPRLESLSDLLPKLAVIRGQSYST